MDGERLSPSEAIVEGFMDDGETEAVARILARIALGSLVAAGYVLQIRDGACVDADGKEIEQ